MSKETTSKGNESGSSRSARHAPLVFLHSVGDGATSEQTLEIFRDLGWKVRTDNGDLNDAGDEAFANMKPGHLGELLREHERRSPGRPLLVIDAGLTIGTHSMMALQTLMDESVRSDKEPVVLTALSNAEPDLNPWSGLEADSRVESNPELAEKLVALLGPGFLHGLHLWPKHLLFFSAPAVQVLAQTDPAPATALTTLTGHDGQLLVADHLFVHDPGRSLFEGIKLEAHEQRRPMAWGLLSQRLDNWLHSDLAGLPDFDPANRAMTLHISHSWGGGVTQWVESFIRAAGEGRNMQLRSEGPQSGQGAGQRLSLYLGNKADCPVASWWLQPPIRSSAVENEPYRAILREITRRYCVGRIIVSSLVGHSLDALETGLPTVQVLHDFYPCWPLLGIHPGQYLDKGEAPALARALKENRLLPDFRGRSAESWEDLANAWRETVSKRGIKVVAPSRSVAKMIRRMDPAWGEIEIEIIPHGLPAMPTEPEIIPRKREDGKIRLLVLGRVQQGKGRDLLLEALPELTPLAHIYLVGAGKEAEVFFGKSGIDIILQYKREELPGTLASIGPHLGAVLSVVPETFSYTLSELQHFNIPVVATMVGSLEERIVDGETGWLIEPDTASLVEKVKFLSANRKALDAMRSSLSGLSHPDASFMAGQYDQLCPPASTGSRPFARRPIATAQTDSIAWQQLQLTRQLRDLQSRSLDLQREIENRTRWAEDTKRALAQEQERRDRWVKSLNEQLDERFDELQAVRSALDHEQSMLEQSHMQYAHLKTKHEWVLASASWRITRPFRVIRRILRNFVQARAWNPLRWPLLISQLIRTLKTQGLKGALMRSQLAHQKTFIPDGFEPEQVDEIGNPDAPASFREVSDPDVSIIIPAYNKWVYTAACLRSLAETTSRASFEVIVVDDQSSDESADRLAAVEGLKYIRNDKNLGFIGSCNRGAESARGQYVLMLNNDTQVLDGWLDALLETFERFPDTGLAGARLMYPDGSLQENGGIVFNDGSGWNYGKNDMTEKPEYQFTREVDYCSGACIMLRTELFRDLNGFDVKYSPAYYEDTDLAFRVRAKGLKVRVQPRATIVHHEGVTSGTDVSSGVKRHQEANQVKFLERWKDELESYPAPPAGPDDLTAVRKARDHHLKGRILIIDAYTPEPDQDSGSLRLRYLLDCFLKLGYGITFFADNRGHSGRYTIDLQQAGVEVLYNPWLDSLHEFFRERGTEFCFVMISRHYVATNYISLLERYCPDAKFIFDTVDLHYLREERLAELEDSLPLRRVAAQTRRSELAVIRDADATLVVSPVEKSVLKKDAPDARVHVISNVHQIVGSRQPWSRRKDIFFVGGYQHPPNVDAARWFVNSIWPLVREKLPELCFHLIGSKAPEQVQSLQGNGVQFHGFVQDLEPWLDGCRLAVAPLRYGAGIKGKVNISMSRGQPVVATPSAVEGMFVKNGEEVLVAESAQDFANAIIRLYQDERLWNHISAAGVENVRKYFSIDTARKSLDELLRTLN